MAQKTHQKIGSKTGSSTLEFDEFELQNTMQDFLKEEPKEDGKGVWNFATFAGLGMLFIAMTFILQLVGFPMGSALSGFAEGAVEALPIIGGILVTLVGFGFLVGDRKREKKAKKEKEKKSRQSKKYRKKNIYSDDIHGAEDFSGSLKNDLDSDFSSSTSSDYSYDNFGYRHAKRLMKSRTNKKIAGVCGGLAKYFGLSSTVVRFIFGAVAIMSWGTSILIYLGLALAMPKEPIEMMDDFDY